jgi:hypothetical protein
MKRKILFTAISYALELLSSVILLFITGLDTHAADNAPYPITVGVGQAVSICTTGTVICPVRFTTCEDTSIATIRDGDQGPEIVGVKPGMTLCYTTSANAVRFAYKVTVHF